MLFAGTPPATVNTPPITRFPSGEAASRFTTPPGDVMPDPSPAHPSAPKRARSGTPSRPTNRPPATTLPSGNTASAFTGPGAREGLGTLIEVQADVAGE